MQEIIEILDKADEAIRKRLGESDYSLGAWKRKEVLKEVRGNVQKAITSLLAISSQ